MTALVNGKKAKKLPRGVYEKVPGSKDYWIRFADPTGKIRRQHIGKSLAATKDIVEQRRVEVRQGKFNPDSVGKRRRKKMTVKEMFDHFLPLRIVRNTSEDARYAEYWTKQFGGLALDDLHPADLEKWRAKRLTEVKPATVNRALEYLKAFYSLATRDEHCLKNPVVKVALLEENNERHRWMNDPEEARLEKAMDSEDYDLVLFGFTTGLRQGEQFKLGWEHVDLANKVMKIIETKAGGHRHVPLNPEAIGVLERQRRRHPDVEWVFPGCRLGTARDAHNFCRRIFKPALTKARIKDFTWHDLRHTYCSRLAMNGVPLHTIAKLVGHSTTTVTKRYSHLSSDHLQKAVDTLSRAKKTDQLTPLPTPPQKAASEILIR